MLGGLPAAGARDCRSCRHFLDDPVALEEAFPGLLILSSASGSTRGDAGICALDECFRVPRSECEQHCARIPEERERRR